MTTEQLYQIFESHPVVTTDSRDCPEGSIFFALKGASFNGNKFAAVALQQGCAFAVVDEPEYCAQGDERYILVDDVLRAFQLLARHHRRTLGTRIVGITGTNGKTTTKELMAAVLGEKYNVLYTLGNFNNDIGVPKTLLRLKPEHQVAVVEMGASHPGDIKALVELVEPDLALITNVGMAHLQGFGSFEGVVKTKGELYDFMRQSKRGKVFVDANNPHLMGIVQGLDLVKYGTPASDGLFVGGKVVSAAPFLRFAWQREGGEWNEVQTHLVGAYNVLNMLAAISVGLYLGVSADEANRALANYVPSNNRSQLEETAHNKLIMDAYNANPTSMSVALNNLNDMEVPHKMAILGDMLELGAASAEAHQAIVDQLSRLSLDEVWLVGPEFARTRCAFRKFNDVDEVIAQLQNQCPEGRYILVKGSHGIRLDKLSQCL
ncbi:UDP-N-acetylmuramoyl-tripeptide--D-alanyl-D-alanine ligase [Hoylesella shahii]|jgi:UDP-N-acetylmuramoyl-tripeptide--D-alanyl-D-alanine ligase|uniref:UDP-N-acetylmuramoyl-tripeptide--D-alanyl-D-alanine ligase n=1 Tax=Hoylesella shahii DSM 15611 = JCM 12083 TaxID=1122991 RepID=A0A318I255_9BACT|nr:UDP-N-acetylmuramoyl-tripeptide--D-alanyl-D-alanine ligase [Hoylesella shahii]PXX23190.1 UDP-N-acetylmuramoyl-tripeptide--D-alanyl-D-alanine ligase [Hoylesella shahii DSM 15611 = JCM 12083]